jgi:hypothetical protein
MTSEVQTHWDTDVIHISEENPDLSSLIPLIFFIATRARLFLHTEPFWFLRIIIISSLL